MTRAAAAFAQDHNPVFADDIQRTAWAIAARHLTAGQKDVTKMIADGIRQERSRCIELADSALGADSAITIFIADPSFDW